MVRKSKKAIRTVCDNRNPELLNEKVPKVQNLIWQNKYIDILEILLLILICLLSFSTRLFSVVIFESIIHEFDPWFNYRVAKYIADNGYLKFFYWFDTKAWYPFGRKIFKTTYYGMMFLTVAIYRLLKLLNINVHIREVCVFLGPLISIGTCLVVYHLARDAWDPLAGIISALLISIIPGYMSRSVAGSYDYECVAIFAMLLAFAVWLKACERGTVVWSIASAFAYFFMVSVWGGYIFVLNLIVVHVSVLFVLGLLFNQYYNDNIYMAYTIHYILGSLLTKFVLMIDEFHYVFSATHFPALIVFVLLQIHRYIVPFVKRLKSMAQKIGFVGFFLIIVCYFFRNPLVGVSGRVLQILGISHGISLVNSIAEHQKTTLMHYFNDLHYVLFAIPIGMICLAVYPSTKRIFTFLFVFSSGVLSMGMVRVLLVLSPAACIAAGITISVLIKGSNNLAKRTSTYGKHILHIFSVAALAGLVLGFSRFKDHSFYTAQNHLSHPTVILSYNHEGTRHYADDFREGLLWLRYNTKEDSKILSWWDYGYQITGFSNRTVYVDNNTNNDKHIAWVGMILASDEETAYKEMIKMDVDYALVLFGGKIGYSGDDSAKAYWILKIASGFYKSVDELWNFNIDQKSDPRFKKSLIYKMLYYRFDEISRGGYDLNKKQRLYEPNGIKFKYLEEAYTTKNWMFRIYRVKKPHEM